MVRQKLAQRVGDGIPSNTGSMRLLESRDSLWNTKCSMANGGHDSGTVGASDVGTDDGVTVGVEVGDCVGQ